MQAMTIETRRASACAVSLFPFRCKGGKHKPRHQAKVTVSVQQDQDQQNGRMEVIMESQDSVIIRAFGSRRPTLVRITCTICPPSKWMLLAPFPLNIWEEDQGLYK